MQGWKLFKHAVRMVGGNWREALRIFLLPTLLGMGVLVALGYALASQSPGAIGTQFLSVIVILVVVGFIAIWTVVAWHRFVILEERPTGWIPPMNRDRMASYFGHGMLMWLMAFGLMIPIAMLFFLAQAVNAGLLVLVVAVPLFLFLAVMWLSISIILPAAAIGKPIKIREALDATRHAGLSFLLLLLLVGLLQGGIEFLVSVLQNVNEIFAVAVSVVLSAFLGVLNISILTTLYGHYIEGRPID